MLLKRKNTVDETKDDPKDDPKELSERQRLILSLIRDNGTITREEMTQKTAMSDATIKRNIADLQSKGYLNRFSGRKENRWVVK